MADVGIPDDILQNIFARLPGKPLVRFRFVSKHWMRLITDPLFMKSRSRRMILLSTTSHLHLVDDNLPIDDPDHSVINLCPPLEQEKGTKITVVGTFNGIALLLLSVPRKNHHHLPSPEIITKTSRMILYNPLTRVSKEIPNPPYNDATTCAIGFGYGATPDDLKIVTIDVRKTCDSEWSVFNVFDLKTNSRSAQFGILPAYSFHNHMEGFFVNGVLYWVANNGTKMVILAVNVKDNMVVSKIDLPHQCNSLVYSLGSLHGSLCLINTTNHYTRFNVWVAEEEEEGVTNKSWSKLSSFDFGLEGIGLNVCYPVRILDHGRILMADGFTGLFIYDASNHTSKLLVSLKIKNFKIGRGVEYVESFVSPSDMC